MRSVEQLCALCVFGALLVVFMFLNIPRGDAKWKITEIATDFSSLSSYNICVVPDVIKGVTFDEDRITLVIHASFDRVGEKIAVQVNNWEGPVSLAIVFPNESNNETLEFLAACTVQKLNSLVEAHPNISTRLSAHFVFPNRGSADCPSFRDPNNQSCSEPARNVSRAEALDAVTAYPINLARNVARKLSKTKFILIADMDHIFSENFESKMAELARKELTKRPKLALVYRIFEIVNEVKDLPRTKSDLFKLYKSKKAFEFHKDYYAHKIPKLIPWFEVNETTGSEAPTIQFVHPYKTAAWEPQFVSLRTIPLHDEAFSYPSRDNTVLRWEMCRAGYKFAIVNDVFMFHHGIKSSAESAFVRAARKKIAKLTSRSIHGFNKRMDHKYPLTKDKCPKFAM